MALEVEGYTLPVKKEDGSALVYVVRPSFLGKLIRFNVFLDGKEIESEMGYTRGKQYIYFYVSPGTHQISSKAENWADITIDAKAGELIFIKQDVKMGLIMARNQISQIDIVEGKYHVLNTELGTIIKTRK
ncbi:MAG: DUF2846 domain-containing protein [Proteobacteria bacterium]|nr:DUF2846 domain-containing protein [Pseudomonadota bacterium]